ncbi:hypothetical protein Hdeb2414_s0004g00132711 [Helianthus debilis subsp. tardiflorus]
MNSLFYYNHISTTMIFQVLKLLRHESILNVACINNHLKTAPETCVKIGTSA